MLYRELVNECPGLVMTSITNGYPSYYLNLQKIVQEAKLGELHSLLRRCFGDQGRNDCKLPVLQHEAYQDFLSCWSSIICNLLKFNLPVRRYTWRYTSLAFPTTVLRRKFGKCKIPSTQMIPNPLSLIHFSVLLYNLEDFYCQHSSRIGLLWLLAIAKVDRSNAGLRIWSIIHQFKRIESKTIAERVLMASQETSTTLHSLLKAGLIAIQASSSLPFCLDIGWAHKSISLLISGLGKLPCCTTSQTEGMSLAGVKYRWVLRLCESLQESIFLGAL